MNSSTTFSAALARRHMANRPTVPDFGDSVRAVFFQTAMDEFLYATHGGTLFIVKYRAQLFGITCKHVFQDFEPRDLFITQEKFGKKGSKPAPIEAIAFPSAPNGEAVGTDVEDLCVIVIDQEVRSDFFLNTEYVLNPETIASSHPGDRLVVVGALKEKSSISPPDISIGYGRLEFGDDGPSADPFLRRAVAVYLDPGFTSITGLSGAPVFNLTANALAGMIVRGSLRGGVCSIYYIDVFDLVKLLEGLVTQSSNVQYTKVLVRRR